MIRRTFLQSLAGVLAGLFCRPTDRVRDGGRYAYWLDGKRPSGVIRIPGGLSEDGDWGKHIRSYEIPGTYGVDLSEPGSRDFTSYQLVEAIRPPDLPPVNSPHRVSPDYRVCEASADRTLWNGRWVWRVRVRYRRDA